MESNKENIMYLKVNLYSLQCHHLSMSSFIFHFFTYISVYYYDKYVLTVRIKIIKKAIIDQSVKITATFSLTSQKFLSAGKLFDFNLDILCQHVKI